MQNINLTRAAAERLVFALTERLDRNKDTERVEIRCGDAEGEPRGWQEFEIHLFVKAKSYEQPNA